MERLTERFKNGQAAVYGCGNNCKYDFKYCHNHLEDCPTINDIYEKLASYEDLEEQGKLLKLPCAVGDMVYVIEVDEENFTHFYCPRKISEYKFNLQMLDLLELFGKCIFLTREEAEAALKGISA